MCLLAIAATPRRASAAQGVALRVAVPVALLVALAFGSLAGCASTEPGSVRSTPVLTLEAVNAIVANPERSAADRTNDRRRQPIDLLNFIGVRPGMVALDISAGGGYTTELLARAVGPIGRVYGQSPPPAPAVAGAPLTTSPPTPPRRTSAMALAERAKTVPNIVAVVRPFDDPVPPELAMQKLDLVTLMYNYHDLGHLGVDRAAMNKAIFAALKPGGMYVIADHAGRKGTGISESDTLHRVEEEFVAREVAAAGFQLAEQGMFLRNPNDPRDRETPLPPEKKDEFVLKFVKPTGAGSAGATKIGEPYALAATLAATNSRNSRFMILPTGLIGN